MVTVHRAIALCSLIVKSLARAVRFLATASARGAECQSGAEPSERIVRGGGAVMQIAEELEGRRLGMPRARRRVNLAR